MTRVRLTLTDLKQRPYKEGIKTRNPSVTTNPSVNLKQRPYKEGIKTKKGVKPFPYCHLKQRPYKEGIKTIHISQRLKDQPFKTETL